MFPVSIFAAVGSAPAPINAFMQSDPFGRLIVLALLAVSVWGFTLIFHKSREIARAMAQTKRFQRIVDAEGSWEELFLASKKHPESPLAALLKETYVECRMEDWFRQSRIGIEGRLEIAKRTIEGILAKTITDEEARLQRQLPTLATIAGVAPLIGLFGTVWGVMLAFQAIGVEGSSGIAKLAPGVSSALTTTILGLFAAIPAYIMHNRFLARIAALSGGMETFSQELENAVRKQLLQEDGKRS